eukprot:232434-Pelagomonas_calceolata.AAC.3
MDRTGHYLVLYLQGFELSAWSFPSRCCVCNNLCMAGCCLTGLTCALADPSCMRRALSTEAACSLPWGAPHFLGQLPCQAPIPGRVHAAHAA